MSKILVVSQRHDLLWMAFKLSKEGQDVSTLCWKRRYDAAWEGLLDKMHGPRTTKVEAWEDWLKDPELVVLTDVPGEAHLFRDSARLFTAAGDTDQTI